MIQVLLLCCYILLGVLTEATNIYTRHMDYVITHHRIIANRRVIAVDSDEWEEIHTKQFSYLDTILLFHLLLISVQWTGVVLNEDVSMMLLHMVSSGNWTTDLLTMRSSPYPLSHVLKQGEEMPDMIAESGLLNTVVDTITSPYGHSTTISPPVASRHCILCSHLSLYNQTLHTGPAHISPLIENTCTVFTVQWWPGSELIPYTCIRIYV